MQNYFSVFSLPTAFDLDVAALEKRYFDAQRQSHPDRLVGKSAPERQQAISQSMLVNEAYAGLRSPLERARHLLLLQGISVGSEQDSVKPSHSLLTEIMELREALAEAETSRQVERIEVGNAGSKEKTIDELSSAFQSGDLPRAAQLTIRLGYQVKMDDEIRIKKKGLAA